MKAEETAKNNAAEAQRQRDTAKTKTIEDQQSLDKFLAEQREKEKKNFEQYYSDGVIAMQGEEYELAKKKFNKAIGLITTYGEKEFNRKKSDIEKLLKATSKSVDSLLYLK